MPWQSPPRAGNERENSFPGIHPKVSLPTLASQGGADSLYEVVPGAMGAPDVVVNNAGTIYREPAENHDLQAWMTVVQVNLNSVFRLSQLAGRSMLDRRQGKIINIASLLSFQGGIRVPAYAASKGGRGAIDKGAGQ